MNEQLNLMKELLGIEFWDSTKETILTHFLTKSRDNILGYCNITDLPTEYDYIVVDYAVVLYRNRDSAGVTRKSEGERSITYEEGIPQSIRLALPLPKIKVGY